MWTLSLLLLILSFGEFLALQWIDGDTQAPIHAWTNDSASLGFSFNMTNDEVLYTVRWLYKSFSEEEAQLIAVFLQGSFAFMHNTGFTNTNNWNITFSNLTRAQSGTYTMHVITRHTGLSSIRRDVVLNVTDFINVWWTEEDIPSVRQVCFGSNFTIGFNFTLAHGVEVIDVKWIFKNATTMELLANLTGRTVNPSNGSLVVQAGDYAVALPNSTLDSAGNYTMRVNVKNPTRKTTAEISRDLVILVKDSANYSSNRMTMQLQHPTASTNGENAWVRMTCGPLEWIGNPPSDVVWKTPSGKEIPSSGYENASFYLDMEYPFIGGNYTCGFPARARSSLCVHSNSPIMEEAELSVDRRKILVILMEEEEKRAILHAENLDRKLQQVKDANQVLIEQVQELKDTVDQYARHSSAHVGFQAELGCSRMVWNQDIIKFQNVRYNDGGAYDGSTGIFKAPQPGTYLFYVTVTSSKSYHYSNCRLKANGRGVAVIRSMYYDYTNPSSMHAVVPLAKDQEVWVEAWDVPGGHGQYDSSSLFTGILINSSW